MNINIFVVIQKEKVKTILYFELSLDYSIKISNNLIEPSNRTISKKR